MPSIFEQMDKNTSLSKLAGSVSRMPSGSIMNLSLSCLEDMPDNDVVFTYKEDIINELVERIQEIGFKDPIKVMPIEHGKYRIISGHQRKIAAERLGWESVPCIVYRDLDERQARDLWRDENMLNRKKTPYLYAQVLKTYLDDYAAFHEGGGSYRYAAKKCGISKSQVPRYLLILRKSVILLTFHTLLWNRQRILQKSRNSVFPTGSNSILWTIPILSLRAHRSKPIFAR